VKQCQEKSRFVSEFNHAGEAYSKAAQALRARMSGDVSKVSEDLQRTQNESGGRGGHFSLTS